MYPLVLSVYRALTVRVACHSTATAGMLRILFPILLRKHALFSFCFFFQAEDGIRDWSVTGVQTCALPICTIQLSSKSYTIVGVLPPGFQMANQAQVFVPKIEEGELLTEREDHSYQVVARLKSGKTFQEAETEMNTIAARLESQYPKTDKNWKVKVVPLREQLAGDLRFTLLILRGAVAFVLLIACANLAGLLLARTAARRKEIAIRAALGAGRWRVIRQLITESVVLAAVGGAFGVMLAHMLIGLTRVVRPDVEALHPWYVPLATPIA